MHVYNGTTIVASQASAGSFTNVKKDYYYAIGLYCGQGELEDDNYNQKWTLSQYSSISGTLKIVYAS